MGSLWLPKDGEAWSTDLVSSVRSEWGPGQVASLSLGFYSLKRDNGPPLVDGLHEVILSLGRISRNVTLFVHLRTAHLDKYPEHSPHNSKGHNTSGETEAQELV